MTLTQAHRPALAVALALAFAGAAQAQIAPDAGQVSREAETLTPPPSAAAPRILETAPAAKIPDTGVRVQVSRFRITGASVIPTAELQALVADFAGRSLSLGELDVAAQRITARYRQAGYAVARAYLPQQEIAGGEVEIRVLEGRIDQRRLKNSSGLSDARVDAYLGDIRSGDVIRSAQIDRGLLLLNDTPGVTGARATLQPGASVGTADLVVEAAPGRRLGATASVDNYGNRYTGEVRARGGLVVNSPLHMGDRLTADLLTSGRGLQFGRLAYQTPVGADGLRIGAAAYRTRYRLGEDFRVLDAHGQATSVNLLAIYPFIRSAQANLSGAATVEQKDLEDEVGATATVTRKRARLATFGLVGTRQDRFLSGGISSFDLSVITGELDIRSATARAIDAASARTQGTYARVSLNLGRFQRVTPRDIVVLTASAQRASGNLDSSEKFALGGVNGVRAYPQGEGIGDEGAMGTVEWRHDILPRLQAAVFYDLGQVRLNRNAFAPGNNSRTLSGAGLGLYAGVSRLQLKAVMAWRIEGGKPTSIPKSKTPTVWVQASAAF